MRSLSNATLALLATLAALTAELALLAAVATPGAALDGPRGWLQAATVPQLWWLHATLCAGGLLLYGREAHRRLAYAPEATLALVVAAFLGPVGLAIAAIALAIVVFTPERWRLQSQGAALDATDAALIREASLSVDGALEPQSLCDVFRFGSLAERRSALALIGANFRPQLAEALRMALHDEHNAIRVQAGMVMQTLEDAFDRKRQRLEARTSDLLTDHGFGADDAWLELGRLYDHQAYSGLLDETRTALARGKARQAYERHLEDHPDDVEAIASIGRLLIRAKRAAEASDFLNGAVEGGHVSVSILMWLAEALYQSERYEALRLLIGAHGELLRQSLPPESPLREAWSLWRGQTSRGGSDELAG